MGNALAPYIGNLAYFLVPFADLTNNTLDAVFLILATIWSIIIESKEHEYTIPNRGK